MKIINPHKFFLIFTLFFGSIISLITPPFQVADEANHFFRAYQISDAEFRAEKYDNRLGGEIPISIIELADQYNKYTLSPYSKIDYHKIVNDLNINSDFDKVAFVDFPNTALYSPVSYIPQALSISVLRYFNCKPLIILYITRIFTLICWILIIYISIKIVPIHKWLFVLLAMLPMSITINSSLSADMITNALSFLFIALILRLSQSEKKISLKELFGLSVILILIGSAKLVYVLLLFIFLTIPAKNFISRNQKLIYFTIILFVGFGSAFLMKQSIDELYTPYNEYNILYRDNITLGNNADMELQIKQVLNNKVNTGKIFIKSFAKEFNTLINSYIGRIGYWDTKVPGIIVVTTYLLIFFLVLFTDNNSKGFKDWQRIILLLTFFCILTAVMLSQYLTWNPVGGDRVTPFQGRYFIPSFPLLFLAFSKKIIRSKFKLKQLTVSIYCLFLGVLTIYLLLNRFYYVYELEKVMDVKCDSEILNEEKTRFKVIGSETVLFHNPDIQTDLNPFRGNYSVKLNQEKPYGYTYVFDQVKKGDMFKVSVWRSGSKAVIVFQEDKENGFYLQSSRIISSTNLFWHKIETDFFAPKDFIEYPLKIYIWYHGKDSAYFDDYQISFYKKQ